MAGERPPAAVGLEQGEAARVAAIAKVVAAKGLGRQSFGAIIQAFVGLGRRHHVRLLRSEELRRRFPSAGDDFKVMGLRRDGELALTVALAMVDRDLCSATQYFEVKQALVQFLVARIGVPMVLNALDDPGAANEAGLHLTVTGTSAEMGDDGQVGRGNRVNGLITPGRPMSLEASVQLVSQIGRPVALPWAASVQVVSRTPLSGALRADIAELARGAPGANGRTEPPSRKAGSARSMSDDRPDKSRYVPCCVQRQDELEQRVLWS